MRRRISLGFLAAAVLAFVAHLASGPALQLWSFDVVGLVAVAGVLAGAARLERRRRLPWQLLALATLLQVLGDFCWTVFEHVWNLDVTRPTGADAFYLAGYPVAASGLVLLGRFGPRSRASVIDALMVATGAGLLSWTFLIVPYVDDASVSLAERIVSMAYPLGDVLLLSVVVRLAFAPHARRPTHHLLIAAFAVLLVCHTAQAVQRLAGMAGEHELLGALLLAGPLLLAAAAFHPTALDRPLERPERLADVGPSRRIALTLAALMAPGVLAIEALLGRTPHIAVIAAASAILTLLALLRMNDLTRALATAMGGVERSAGRERVLRAAGEALVRGREREAIYEAAIDAVKQLAPGVPRLRVFVAVGGATRARVVAAAGANADDAKGVVVRFDALPVDVRATLASGEALVLPQGPLFEHREDGPWVLSGPIDVAVPLLTHAELYGVLVVSSDAPLPDDCHDALTALGVQLSLALETLALNEDVLRSRSEAHFRSLVQTASDMILICDPDGTVRYASPAVERVVGHPPGAVVDTHVLAMVHPDDRDNLSAYLQLAMASTGPTRPVNCRLQHRDGSWRHVETVANNLVDDPTVKGIVCTSRDVTESRALEEQLRHQAFHDPLTGLANRALFTERVSRALRRRDRGPRRHAVLFFDLDDFKTVNDSLGHAAGDHLLQSVARRIAAALRVSDTAARLGGDEFAVLLEDVDGVESVVGVTEEILAAVAEPLLIEGKQVRVSTSVGIAVETEAGEPVEVLLRNADAAMYVAKTQGGSAFRLFEPSMHHRVLARLELGTALQGAVGAGELVMRYQPIVDLDSGRTVKCEALVRWQHPERGLLAPLEFIPLAEETGIIVGMGRWLLEESCRQARRWLDAQPDLDLTVGVNVSGRQLEEPDFVEMVTEALDAARLDPRHLTLEITESVLMRDADATVDRLHRLKALGIGLAIDDFGTGYSSLGYLRQFPIDVIKIDKTFVDAVGDGGRDTQLIRTIVELAAGLGTTTVAEGIETPEQARELLDLGCSFGQGYHYARPLDAPAFEARLRDERALSGAGWTEGCDT